MDLTQLENMSDEDMKELQFAISNKLSNKTKFAAAEKIAELCVQARELISQAESIADDNSISFDFSVTYGMGGSYTPKDWRASDSCSEFPAPEEGEWNSSSSDC